ncbi:hypothetical protein OIU76_016001 [Salix suchowensis]|uniref:BHLH domain-containing protein n=1 Tax=Salix suchowensis TaxID=1278906 RepID=A0ABQ9AXN6_9ROSI|nr:transcription factor bHLH [Salix suchowensis]KAJ6360845.1 hypothetical protein OIU77_004796 [Salix suchowensis]KAJ6379291.1 hypothetical protein OIU76_016001 [Salix suchowensis]
MGAMVENLRGSTMESSSTRSNISSTKTERKVIEKNRRNQMKTLYSKLNSLLPDQNFKEPLPLPDQIDEAISYIKSLEERLKRARERKEGLTSSRKRSFACTHQDPTPAATQKPPQLKIQELGSALEIVLTSGADKQFLFCEIIRILDEEGAEVVSANVHVLGDSIFQVLHAQMKESDNGFGAAKVTERLNMLINGSTGEVELDSELWDFEIHPEIDGDLFTGLEYQT